MNLNLEELLNFAYLLQTVHGYHLTQVILACEMPSPVDLMKIHAPAKYNINIKCTLKNILLKAKLISVTKDFRDYKQMTSAYFLRLKVSLNISLFSFIFFSVDSTLFLSTFLSATMNEIYTYFQHYSNTILNCFNYWISRPHWKLLEQKLSFLLIIILHSVPCMFFDM